MENQANSIFGGARPNSPESNGLGGSGAIGNIETHHLKNEERDLHYFVTTGKSPKLFVTIGRLLSQPLRGSFSTRIAPMLRKAVEKASQFLLAVVKMIRDDDISDEFCDEESAQPSVALTLTTLPAEILDKILTMSTTPASNGLSITDADLHFEDTVRRNDKRYFEGPQMPALAQTNRQLRGHMIEIIFKDKYISLLHDDVAKTVKFFDSLYPSGRSGIRGLRIEYQRKIPVDYESFRCLCGLLKLMPKLRDLHLVLPVNGPSPYRVILEPGLLNALLWHKDRIRWNLKLASEVLQGFGWHNTRRARWVTDLLGAAGQGFEIFKLTTYPKAEGAVLKDWIEKLMTEDRAHRESALRQFRSQASWSRLPSAQGVLSVMMGTQAIEGGTRREVWYWVCGYM